MQTADALRRVAAECAEDLAADGVVYAEVRYAPELHVDRRAGAGRGRARPSTRASGEGERRAAAAGHPIRVGALLTAMRHAARSMEIAELAIRYRDDGVAGFDIAGAEAGYPPTRHLDAFEYLQRENAHFTIHAGEGFGLPSIWQAIQWCGADRLGHGVRIIDDIEAADGAAPTPRRCVSGAWRRTSGTSASRWRCAPTSNVMTGAAKSIAEHPIGLLRKLYFRVTVNTDNRLMSGTSMTREFDPAGRGVRLRLARLPVVHGQRDEVGVHPVRRAPGADQRRDQAGVRRAGAVARGQAATGARPATGRRWPWRPARRRARCARRSGCTGRRGRIPVRCRC